MWRRRRSRRLNLKRAVTIDDLREIALQRIPGFIFEYLEGGAEDEVTLARNRKALEGFAFLPGTLVDTSLRHNRTMLFDKECAAPLVVAPTGANGLLHPLGDLALARAAERTGIPFCLSTLSTIPLTELARTGGGRLWMQLYLMRDRRVAPRLLLGLTYAGCAASGVENYW